MEIRSKGNQKSGLDIERKTLQTNRAMLIWNPRFEDGVCECSARIFQPG